jgi:predicted nuclease of predicted toxin-antitoxin system
VQIRFHLDEHIPAGIASGLRRRGIDVTTAVEGELAGADDVAQLAFAASAGRVLVTQDADFLRIHAQGAPHAGIVYCHQGSTPMGVMLRKLVLICDLVSPEEMAGKVEFL